MLTRLQFHDPRRARVAAQVQDLRRESATPM
jgi:hypothetical protein